MQPLLEKLCARENLSLPEAESMFRRMVSGEADVIEISAVLIALRCKGETAEELAGAARALLAAAKSFPIPEYDTIDCCGTGGDGYQTLNVSTAVAFVLAAAGVKVVKHGNRAVSSQSGSSDVLRALQINTSLTPEQSRENLDDFNLCFLHAPDYHPGVKHAMPVRQSLKLRTLFNLLGPMINPARPSTRLMGVYDARLLEPVANGLRALGVKRAWVVNGGVDELAVHATTDVAELKQDEIRLLKLEPEQVGLSQRPLATLRGDSAEKNADRMLSVLSGRFDESEQAYADVISLNAGAGLLLMNKVKSLRAGVLMASEIIASGSALSVVQNLQLSSRKYGHDH